MTARGPVDPAVFREALARWAAGVAVVTTVTTEGLHGVTVTAFCPVSAAPPLVLACVDSLARSADLLAAGGCYGVSLLGGRQEFLADRFAGRGPLVNRRFDEAPYFTAATGAPLLQGCLAWLDCRIVATHEAGDHLIFVGSVEAAGVGDATEALVYFDRRYWRLR
ncbi:MAG TPA: flavin reductase family protein [Chloroflexota bacterium]|jgi:flavin reductase (DIM6/NTAB) family NADH-FMN oxidoreductase RutF